VAEVYRATNTNLGRQVAIKILPNTFAHDPEGLARFEREADRSRRGKNKQQFV
jgi:serine/threonine protein kinase